ncbi:MAG TPA: TonB-dependent receptor [Candidatus Saccharimonadales bacterium]|nr:TonB-dependent receptor [Candidatus Saccharimonadales bacterium]
MILSIATLVTAQFACAQTSLSTRVVSGTVVDERAQLVPGAMVTARSANNVRSATTDAQGAFHLRVPSGAVALTVTGKYISRFEQTIAAESPSSDLRLRIKYAIPTAQETLVITARAADPSIDRRNGAIYQGTLFNRDDQLMETLDSGINAGQHEGGGKSLEVRRFGFNLDHGGANGGLKILIDDIPQNQSTQAHGQGYLGSLKALSPELVDDVDIINGPFNPEYGDFSALGVVHIRLKERLDNVWTLRAQGGSFGEYRTFAAWSPKLEHADSFLSWEHAYTDGPFQNPLHYVRDNFTGNFTLKIDDTQSLGFRFSGGRNDFDSSGQIPLDQVLLGNLNRFGFVDPSHGGNVRNATGSVYYKKNLSASDTLRVDAYVTRSLLDLYSNSTFYLNDPLNGDGIQQHDSRLQEGSSAQYVRAGKLFGHPALFIAGANLADSQINVDLFHDRARKLIAPVPGKPWTEDNVHISNGAFYAQEGVDFPHLHIDAGLRFDGYRFNVHDRLAARNSAVGYSNNPEPKMNVVYTPSVHFPAAIHFNFGRAATSEDARSIAVDPKAPKTAATNFYMLGTSHNLRRFSASTDLFLIDRQHESVYSPDSGTIQFQGPSRSYGWEAKTSVQVSRFLSWNAGFTQVSNAFFLGTHPREYVDSAPHTVANSSLTLNAWHGIFSSVRYRHISRYLVVNPDDTSVAPALPYTNSIFTHASGLDVVDFAVTKKLGHGVEWNLSVDNLNNKRYYETQNFFDSRLTPTSPIEARIHGTPGYPVGFTTGLTLRFE